MNSGTGPPANDGAPGGETGGGLSFVNGGEPIDHSLPLALGDVNYLTLRPRGLRVRATSKLDPCAINAVLSQKASELRMAWTALSYDELREWLGQQRRAHGGKMALMRWSRLNGAQLVIVRVITR
jgi:hypothetical protein